MGWVWLDLFLLNLSYMGRIDFGMVWFFVLGLVESDLLGWESLTP